VATDANGNSSSVDVNLTVTDVVDTLPVLTVPTEVLFDENSTDSVLTATLDREVASWSMSGDTFAFDLVDGVLSFKEVPDYEGTAPNEYRVTIEAMDTNNLVASQEVVIKVNDVVEAAPILNDNLNYTINEGQTDIGLYDTQGVAVDWVIAGVDAALFEIVDNHLQFKAAPDFENPLDAGGNNEYNLTLTATVPGTTTTYTDDVTVKVLDLDDTAPVMDLVADTPTMETSGSVISVMEGDNFLTQVAANEDVTYSLQGADADMFKIYQNGQVYFSGNTDYEGDRTEFSVDVVAIDHFGNTTIETVVAQLMDDVDDNGDTTGPVIEQTEFMAVNGQRFVGQLQADEDVTWAFADGTGSLYLSLSSEGELRFTNGMFSNGNEYTISVTATDMSGNTTTQDITINPQDTSADALFVIDPENTEDPALMTQPEPAVDPTTEMIDMMAPDREL